MRFPWCLVSISADKLKFCRGEKLFISPQKMSREVKEGSLMT